MKYPIPLSIPKGFYPIITQAYGDKSRVDWYKANGINISEHNGTDIVISGGKEMTYGTKIVNPFPSNAFLSRSWWEHPMSTKGNGIEIGWNENKDYYRMLAWHCSEICLGGGIYKPEETIGYIGNSGLVDPKPTPSCPFCGSHIHLMVYKNGELIDPMTIFDITKWFVAEADTPVDKDVPPLYWVVTNFIRPAVEALSKLILKK